MTIDFIALLREHRVPEYKIAEVINHAERLARERGCSFVANSGMIELPSQGRNERDDNDRDRGQDL